MNGCHTGAVHFVAFILSFSSLLSYHDRISILGVPGVKPVHIELTDFKTKEKVDELEVDAVMVATGRAPFTQVISLAY